MRPLMSIEVWIAKPLLPCQVTAHHPLVQLSASTRLPLGIFATISLVVPGAARRFNVDATYAGFAIAPVVTPNRIPKLTRHWLNKCGVNLIGLLAVSFVSPVTITPKRI